MISALLKQFEILVNFNPNQMSKTLTYIVALYLILWWAGLIFSENYQLVNLLFLSTSIVSLIITLIYYNFKLKDATD